VIHDAELFTVGPDELVVTFRTDTDEAVTTAVGEREVLTRITIPAAAAARRTAYRKLNLWQGDFAVASTAVSVMRAPASRRVS